MNVPNSQSYAEHDGSVLGLASNQVSRFLAQFRSPPLAGAANDKCTRCETVLLSSPISAYVVTHASLLM
ncbi:uncharacterized protein LACBIDRAFT_316908 [Laccaria bicolor S238N-H82]|uniref:Predicted protein n=1 Tax=Laccaria bicolor (strain S238N-H82 / ATCC MYA-4686) TaxID=486041 RepID=B0D591_LACBS|nr:uncharacterized protein LACBIDRAFT_316908 [Laccaria bicolor S238N-H82]EDR10474.1 predicted protein [Laccaria bicolor S238N-H82]|eukprot:XP_001878924.1 predicted protein [Laccaria bicolor S238N-H82]